MARQDLEAWSNTPFADAEEMAAALGDRRYRDVHGDGYRRAVERKIALGMGDGGVTVSLPISGTGLHYRFDPTQHLDPATGLPDPERIAEQDAADADLRSSIVQHFGPDSMPGSDPFAIPKDFREAQRILKAQFGADAVNPNFKDDDDGERA